MPLLNLIANFFLFLILTILTQIGGVIFLLSRLTNPYTDSLTTNKHVKHCYRCLVFLGIYLICTFLIVPMIAKPFGRVPLPIMEEDHLRPLNILTRLLNRNYVSPELKHSVIRVSKMMNEKYPGTKINYLDANFPFFDHFPLLPHLSHNDGRKIDFAFCYKDATTEIPTNHCPSFIGYGIYEKPQSNEVNTAETCESRGYWQYSILEKVVPQYSKEDYKLDEVKTKALVNLFVADPSIMKIFIEPHLKNRMKLTSSKIRFHGCQAVRHDDHIHIQL
jgi:hypothetical protein